MCEENQENGTGIETEINFFEGLFPHRNGLCPVLLLFSSCDCVILCAAL